MKKHFLGLPYMAIAAFIVLSFSSCEKILPETLNFEMNDVSYTFTLQPADTTGQLTLSTNKLSLNTDSVLTANNVDNYEVSSMKLKSASLVTTGSSDFNSFQSLSAYISSASHPEEKLGENNDIEKSAKTVELKINKNLNVVEFAKEKPTNFTIKGNVVQPLEKPMQITLKCSYDLAVNKKK